MFQQNTLQPLFDQVSILLLVLVSICGMTLTASHPVESMKKTSSKPVFPPTFCASIITSYRSERKWIENGVRTAERENGMVAL